MTINRIHILFQRDPDVGFIQRVTVQRYRYYTVQFKGGQFKSTSLKVPNSGLFRKIAYELITWHRTKIYMNTNVRTDCDYYHYYNY